MDYISDVKLPYQVEPFKYIVASGAPTEFHPTGRCGSCPKIWTVSANLSHITIYHSFMWKSFGKNKLTRNIYGQSELHRRGIGRVVTL
jgi:hypothetical protein